MISKLHLRFLLSLALLASPTVAFAQLDKPAVDYRSLLNMRFDEATGAFQLDTLSIVFPPPGQDQAMLTISRVSGEELLTVPLRMDAYAKFPVFGRCVPESKPASITLGQAGDFLLAIKIGEKVITRFPFSLFAEPSLDPYAPPKRYLREGPWRDFAYFSLPLNKLTAPIRFNWWMSPRELPLGMTNPAISIRLMDNYKDIARSRGSLRLQKFDWQFFTSDLISTKGRTPQQLTLRDLGARDGVYLLIVEADGRPVKSYRLEVKDGRLQHGEQSRIDFEPHIDFITPRFIESSADSGADAFVSDAYWVRRTAVRRSFRAAGLETSNKTSRVSEKD